MKVALAGAEYGSAWACVELAPESQDSKTAEAVPEEERMEEERTNENDENADAPPAAEA